MDHYKTLGVDRNASPDEIRQAYKKLASIHHPDKGGDTARFQEIQSAYETLSDPQKKNEYDMPRGGFPGGGFAFNGFPGGFSFQTGPMNIDDIFGQMFGHRHHVPTYKTIVNLTLEQVYNGDQQTLNFSTNTGPHSVRIDVPKGIENGQQLRYDNLIPNGVLIVEFRIYDHSKFQRNGFNLTSEIEVDVLDLIVGTTIEFQTISGKTFSVSIKPKTQPNTTLALQGHGMPNMHDARFRGRMLLKINVTVPTNLSDAQKDLIRQAKN
jgi:DnaJ-class molecular chaperone